MGQVLLALLLLCQQLWCQSALDCQHPQDYKVMHNGLPSFVVSASNGTCSCAAYSAAGASSFGNVSVSGALAAGPLDVSGVASFAAGLGRGPESLTTVNGGLRVVGNLSLSAGSAIVAPLGFPVTVGSPLVVTGGPITAAGGLAVSAGGAGIVGGLAVSGASSVTGSLTVSGPTELNSTFSVLRQSQFRDLATFSRGAKASTLESGLGCHLVFEEHGMAVTSSKELNSSTSFTDTFTFEIWTAPGAARVVTPEVPIGNYVGSTQRFAVFPSWRNDSLGAGLSVGTNGLSVFYHGANMFFSPAVVNVSLSGWNHVAVVHDARALTVFINGVVVRQGVPQNRTVYPSTLFGEITDSTVPYGPFIGRLDEFRLWTTARTSREIASFFRRSVESTTPGLFMYLAMDECSGNVLIDSVSGATRTLGLRNSSQFVAPASRFVAPVFDNGTALITSTVNGAAQVTETLITPSVALPSRYIATKLLSINDTNWIDALTVSLYRYHTCKVAIQASFVICNLGGVLFDGAWVLQATDGAPLYGDGATVLSVVTVSGRPGSGYNMTLHTRWSIDPFVTETNAVVPRLYRLQLSPSTLNGADPNAPCSLPVAVTLSVDVSGRFMGVF